MLQLLLLAFGPVIIGLAWIYFNYGTMDTRQKRSEARINLKPWTL